MKVILVVFAACLLAVTFAIPTVVRDEMEACTKDDDCKFLDWCSNDGYCMAPQPNDKPCVRDEMCISKQCDDTGECKSAVARVAKWLILTIVIGVLIIIALIVLLCFCLFRRTKK